MSQLGFIIDMDGVIYKGNQEIEGASRFIATYSRERSKESIALHWKGAAWREILRW